MATGSQLNVDLAFLDQSRQDLQIVKCVVVGDTGVGKTRWVNDFIVAVVEEYSIDLGFKCHFQHIVYVL